MNYPFVDTHCHFDFPPFVNHEVESLKQAQQADVKALIVPTVSTEKFEEVIVLTQHYDEIYAALGIHPLYLEAENEQSLHLLESYLQQKNKRVVAIGEIGLDHYYENTDIKKQQWFLQQQLYLAKQYDLPVLLHSRRTHDLLAKELRQFALPRTGIIHGFSGSLEQAQAFIRLGYSIGVGGTITYPRAKKTRAVIASLPLTSLLLETDAPDMPIYGRQGQANRPEYIKDIFLTLCFLRGENQEQIAHQLYLNTINLFKLQLK